MSAWSAPAATKAPTDIVFCRRQPRCHPPRERAVADDRVDTLGRGDRLLERGRVDHRCRIEYAEVGIETRLHLAALGQMEALRRIRRHAAHRVFQREELEIA